MRVAVRWVPLALLVGSDARRLASGTSVAERLVRVGRARVGVRRVHAHEAALVVTESDVEDGRLDNHDGNLPRTVGVVVVGGELQPLGNGTLGLDQLIPLLHVLLGFSRRVVANLLQPGLEPVPEPVVPRVDATPDVALLLVQPVNVRRTVSLNEAVPANSTPLGVCLLYTSDAADE